jgi:hypothetical protein
MGYYGDWGWGGMMGSWGGWGWLMSLTMLVWLVVGILAAIWLWKHIKK